MSSAHPVHRILVPTDFSERSRAALEHAVVIARAFGASIDLLTAWRPPQYVSPDVLLSVPGWSTLTLEDFSHEEAEHELAAFIEGIDGHDVELHTRVASGDPAQAILAAAKDYDLVVMGTRGRRPLSRAVLGSVSAKVAAAAPCPVVVVNTPDA